MYNSFLHEKRAQTAAVTHRKHVEEQHSVLEDEKLRNQFAQRYKQRLDQELLRVLTIQLALDSSSTRRKQEDRPTVKLLGEARFRVQGYRSTLERLEDCAQSNAILDTSASHMPVYLLRPRRKDLELGQAMRYNPKTQAERLTDAVNSHYSYACPQGLKRPETQLRTRSSGRNVPLPEYHSKTHYKTILSLEMNLHTWQQGPQEQNIKDRIREEKLGKVSMEPRKDKPIILKRPIDQNVSLIENIRQVPSTENLVLTQEQKSRLTEEIVRNSDLRRVKNQNVATLRSRIGSSPTTYHSGFIAGAHSVSPGRKTEYYSMDKKS